MDYKYLQSLKYPITKNDIELEDLLYAGNKKVRTLAVLLDKQKIKTLPVNLPNQPFIYADGLDERLGEADIKRLSQHNFNFEPCWLTEQQINENVQYQLKTEAEDKAITLTFRNQSNKKVKIYNALAVDGFKEHTQRDSKLTRLQPYLKQFEALKTLPLVHSLYISPQVMQSGKEPMLQVGAYDPHHDRAYIADKSLFVSPADYWQVVVKLSAQRCCLQLFPQLAEPIKAGVWQKSHSAMLQTEILAKQLTDKVLQNSKGYTPYAMSAERKIDVDCLKVLDQKAVKFVEDQQVQQQLYHYLVSFEVKQTQVSKQLEPAQFSQKESNKIAPQQVNKSTNQVKAKSKTDAAHPWAYLKNKDLLRMK